MSISRLHQLPSINQSVAQTRASLPTQNSLTLQQIQALPPYYGECQIQNGLGKMYLLGNDCGVSLRLFWNGTYETGSINLWKRLARHANTIFDIGAHTGIYSIVAGTIWSRHKNLKLYNQPSIHAFEPYILNAARLSINCKLNSFEKLIRINQLAVSSNCKDVQLNVPSVSIDYLSAGPTLGIINNTSQSFNVHSVSIDHYVNKIQPRIIENSSKSIPSYDLFKIDVEGHETKILEGMKKHLAERSCCIILECVQDESTKESSRILKELGYKFYRINENTKNLTIVDSLNVSRIQEGSSWILDRNNLNALCVPRGISKGQLINIIKN